MFTGSQAHNIVSLRKNYLAQLFLVFEHPLTLFYGWLGKNVTPQVFVFFFGVMELFYFMNLKKEEL